jgi:ribose transport system ATP-binding protein
MNVLEMRNIDKAFSGVTVLSDVSLDIKKGEIHALLGENGAGKSTLMNILTGVLQADNGTITYNGQLIQNNSVKKSEDRKSVV